MKAFSKLSTNIKGAILVFTGIVLILSFAGVSRLQNKKVTATSQSSSGSKTTPLAKRDINQKLEIHIGPKKDAPIVTYELQSAEILKEIIVRGQVASAAPGRAFLIVNLKITNDTTQGLQLNTRDYLRITVADNEKEWIAPDIHNDPVEVQALSTKMTRIGFPIDEDVRKLKLQLGEIDGEKTFTDLQL